MKKLYLAEVSGEFVFVVDEETDKDTSASAVHNHLPDEKFSFNVDNVSEITEGNDIPVDWQVQKPLGANEQDDDDCESYFECRDVAERIKTGLDELGYELEDSFIEDIRCLLKKEI